MKKKLYFVFLILFLTKCFGQVNKKENIVEIHFQEGFINDDVMVLIDNRIIFSKKITTNEQNGFASYFKVSIDIDECLLFKINGDSIQFNLKKKCPFLRVTYSEKTKIMIECSHNRFLYN